MAEDKDICQGHQRHLCALVSEGLVQKEPAQYHGLVRNPQFVCKNCGRVAAKKDNLCSPVKLGSWD